MGSCSSQRGDAGEVSHEAQNLINVTRESLDIALSMVRPGVQLGDIGGAIEKYVKENKLYIEFITFEIKDGRTKPIEMVMEK